ncbi:MAG TPA: hypothetical protein VF670_16540 [Duganella sp.]
MDIKDAKYLFMPPTCLSDKPLWPLAKVNMVSAADKPTIPDVLPG